MQPVPPRAKIAFVATEDWFVASHFLPMIRAAAGLGLEVIVATRVRDHAGPIAAAGGRLVPLEAERRSLSPFATASAVSRLAAIFRTERPDIVHCISLKGIMTGAAAARLAGIDRRILAVTGFGLLGAKTDLVGRSARLALRAAIRSGLASAGTHFLFENSDDPALLGLAATDPRVTIVGGAGVDPQAFAAAPMPLQPPLKVALVSRMLWSKGADIAVEAVTRARARGHDITLSLYGAPDPDNPKAIPGARLAEWQSRDGIAWHGRTRDVGAVWRGYHVCCLPSRGGEGLPRSLLEGAACGRAILTTDVPGCRSFVRDGVEGFVVPPDDAAALAERLAELAADPARVAAMGAAARARVLGGYTEEAVMATVADLYRGMLAR
ncbi:glycosyltransferase [Aurantimonas sp. VKM B-3413]|uniref:glycosyltransferase n=1 Tax=Aurantimonas sp. VKM B-3413 TaxID=2779401 RepID=UPI001E4552B3|nr:glycosyltransferase [Aurantimonas sp. VKM B-3413]MCB8836985.1 glycosyltransferase [Aurantimonas sp. VKM B-3413]